MTETPPAYRTRDRPGPGLARIEEPDGPVTLWSLNLSARFPRPCARCGAVVGRTYHPSITRGRDTPRLCRPCVEGDENA